MFARSRLSMSKVLVVNCSLNGENGNSQKLTKFFVEEWQKKKSGSTVAYRELHKEQLAPLGGAEMAAWMTPAEKRTAEQKSLVAISDKLIAELQSAETIVIGLPMYNFGVPSTFKAWIDRLARAGITFRYTETGPVGLVQNKKVYVLCARGGLYKGTPNDTQTPYMKQILAFMGMTDVEFVFAEGFALGPESAAKASAAGQEDIKKIIRSI